MEQTLKNIKIADLPELIKKLGLSPNQEVDLIIKDNSDDLISIMDRIGKKAQEQGLTEEMLQELLANPDDESNEVILSSLCASVQQVKEGKIHPISELWDDIDV